MIITVDFLQDYEMTQEEIIIITDIYEKVINSRKSDFLIYFIRLYPKNLRKYIHKFKEKYF